MMSDFKRGMGAGIYILQKIRNYAKPKIQNGKTLPKQNIAIYSKFGQYYRYDITMYDFIHIIQFLIPIWSFPLIYQVLLGWNFLENA
jgi:hypothetical protein